MAQIDVVMPVKNCAATLRLAIDSILQQTFFDISLIIINDGSSDETCSIVNAYVERDSRVALTHSSGSGIVDALNHGIRQSSAPYVARMDADDISHPARLERQYAFISENPHVAVVGSGVNYFGSSGGCPPILASASDCSEAIGLFSPVCHPSALFRRAALDRLDTWYSSEFPYAEDYELFSRLIGVGELCNITEPLIDYRLHPNQISQTKQATQRRSSFQISTRHIVQTYGVSEHSKARILSIMARKAARLGVLHHRESYRALRNAVLVAYGSA